MESLIFVGGIQYSGKSYFARSLEASYPSRYKHIELDGLLEHLTQRREVFLGLIKRYDRDLYRQIEYAGRQLGIKGDYDLLTLFANYMIQEGRFSEFENIQQLYVLLYASVKIRGSKKGIIPIIDGAFTNNGSRSIVYQTLRAAFGERIPLDKLQKLFVYFNLGLDLSLERFKQSRREEKKSLRWSEDLVRRTYRGQEIPEPSELSNLEVIVINNLEELERITERLSRNA